MFNYNWPGDALTKTEPTPMSQPSCYGVAHAKVGGVTDHTLAMSTERLAIDVGTGDPCVNCPPTLRRTRPAPRGVPHVELGEEPASCEIQSGDDMMSRFFTEPDVASRRRLRRKTSITSCAPVLADNAKELSRAAARKKCVVGQCTKVKKKPIGMPKEDRSAAKRAKRRSTPAGLAKELEKAREQRKNHRWLVRERERVEDADVEAHLVRIQMKGK